MAAVSSAVASRRPEVTFECKECPECRSKTDVHSDVELADRAALFERARVAGVRVGVDAARVLQKGEDLGVEVCVGVSHRSKLARRRGKPRRGGGDAARRERRNLSLLAHHLIGKSGYAYIGAGRR